MDPKDVEFFVKRAEKWDEYLESLDKEEVQRIFSNQEEYIERYREFCNEYKTSVED